MATDIAVLGFLIATLGAFREGDHAGGLIWLVGLGYAAAVKWG